MPFDVCAVFYSLDSTTGIDQNILCIHHFVSMFLSYFQSANCISTCCEGWSCEKQACGSENTLRTRWISVILMGLLQCWCGNSNRLWTAVEYIVLVKCRKQMHFIIPHWGVFFLYFVSNNSMMMVNTNWGIKKNQLCEFCHLNLYLFSLLHRVTCFCWKNIYQPLHRLLSTDDTFSKKWRWRSVSTCILFESQRSICQYCMCVWFIYPAPSIFFSSFCLF